MKNSFGVHAVDCNYHRVTAVQQSGEGPLKDVSEEGGFKPSHELTSTRVSNVIRVGYLR